MLYDFYHTNGSVDENVFAYSNRFNDERGLIIYHNRFADTRGWIKTSAAYLDKGSGDLRQKFLAEGLGLPFEGFVIYKDYVTHVEYIHACAELWEKGLYVELNAYQCHAFMDFRFVESSEWESVNSALNGAGVQSMQAKFDEMFGAKKEIIAEEVKVKKPRKKAVTKKKEESGKKASPKLQPTKKSAAKKDLKKKPVSKKTIAKKSEKAKKPKPSDKNFAAKKTSIAKKLLKTKISDLRSQSRKRKSERYGGAA